MALKGYISPGTYASIGNTIYEKDMSRCTVVLTIYSDVEKTNVLGNTSVIAEGFYLTPAVESITTLRSTPPETPADMFYLVGPSADGAWSGCDGRIAKRDEQGTWNTYILANNSFLLFVEDEQRYREYKNGIWIERLGMTTDKRIWDKYLAPEVALGPNTNPTKQMYSLIKTLPQFQNCEDV